MKTPICDFINNYNNNLIRFHMPGHKGRCVLGFEKNDITEIDGADVLYDAQGIIRESEDNASMIFASKKTFYSAEGSSLCIRAMVYLIKMYSKSKNQSPLILATRNAHKTFVTSLALLDVNVRWIYSDDSILSCNINLNELEKNIIEHHPTALYITSPDYLGNIEDINSISKICKKYNVLLLVDNAHGAYLKFLDKSAHPLDLGADICCDSAHKTLPVITGGAYLHIGKNTDDFFACNAQNALSLFASTSPSYLILQSLDYVNKTLSTDFKDKLDLVIKHLVKLKYNLTKLGYELVGDELLKITIDTKKYGYLGIDFAKILRDNNIICEFYDSDYVVFMVSSNTQTKELEKLENILGNIPKKDEIILHPPKIIKPEIVLTPNEALMSNSIETDVTNALDKILATPTVNCPPAVCVAVCGERINQSVIDLFKYYGIKKCNIVLE